MRQYNLRKVLFTLFVLLQYPSFVLAGEKENCLKKENSTWVRGYFRKGYYRSDGVHVKPTNVKSHCRSYNKKELLILSKLKEGKVNRWPHNEKFKNWNYEEKRRVLTAIKKLPSKLLKNLQFEIYRAKKSTARNNPARSAPSVNKIVLYDSAFFITHNLYEVIIHELSHILYHSLDDKIKTKYLEVAKWKKVSGANGKRRLKPFRKKFVKEDGVNSPDEDFSNNVESYFSHKKKIKKLNPSIYQWMENFFKGGSK